MSMNIPARDHDRIMGMIAAIMERGDDHLADQQFNDARWVIDLLLGQLGYKLHITEDGDVEIWPEDGVEPGDSPYYAKGYRAGKFDGQWYDTDAKLRAAIKDHEAMERALKLADDDDLPPVLVNGRQVGTVDSITADGIATMTITDERIVAKLINANDGSEIDLLREDQL